MKSRNQFVSINSVDSSTRPVEFGVPQGSILGPLLFLIYINDLPQVTKFFIRLYADDTFLCLQHEDIKVLEREVNLELKKVYQWLVSNRLTLNISKSKYMLVSKRKNALGEFTIKINNTALEKCETYKYLGVHFDKNLNWKSHIEYISEKISKSCGALAKLRHCVEIDTLREVYYALVHSYLRYGIIAWGNASKTVLNKLQVIVNRTIRIITFAPLGQINLNPIYEILEILKVNDIYTLEIAKIAYKQNKNLLTVNVAKYFQESSTISGNRTSSRITLITKHLTPFRKKSNVFGMKFLVK